MTVGVILDARAVLRSSSKRSPLSHVFRVMKQMLWHHSGWVLSKGPFVLYLLSLLASLKILVCRFSVWNRYRVTMSVSDSTDTASFLAFDLEMSKLTSIPASEAAQIVVLPHVNHCIYQVLVLIWISDVYGY